MWASANCKASPCLSDSECIFYESVLHRCGLERNLELKLTRFSACECDLKVSTGECEEGSGRCLCRPEYAGLNCDRSVTSSFGQFGIRLCIVDVAVVSYYWCVCVCVKSSSVEFLF